MSFATRDFCRLDIAQIVGFGKGINSKSALNLAGCAADALAKTMGALLLIKGNDFAATDLVTAAVCKFCDFASKPGCDAHSHCVILVASIPYAIASKGSGLLPPP